MNPIDENGTEWRPVPGYEGVYEASDDGRVKRLANSPKCHKDRLLKPSKHTGGYNFVTLCSGGIPTRMDIHRIVMLAFYGPSDLWVNHKNGIKIDNRLVNLEYTTPSENAFHAYHTGLQPSRLGEGNGHAKLTDEEVRQIRAMAANDIPRKDIAEHFRASKTAIQNVIVGASWRHVA